MKRHIFTVALAFLAISSSASAKDIIVVKSANLKPYNEALIGFKSVARGNISEVLLPDINGSDIRKEIERERPDLIIAVDEDALSQVKGVNDIPIVYMMVSNPQAILNGERNITGVSMNISAKKQVDMLSAVSPHRKRIGIIYDPNNTFHLVKDIQSSSNGFTLITERIYSRKEVPSVLKSLRGQIDVIWLLPDITVISQETFEFILLFSLENGIPIIAFSEKYVQAGSLMALDIDPTDIGLQAGEMANRILSGTDAGGIPVSSPRKAVFSLNLKIAQRLGIVISEEVLKKAQKVYK